MQIDYDVLERAAATLTNAQEPLRGARQIACELGAGSPSPDIAYGDTVVERIRYCGQLGAAVCAQGGAFRDTVEEFRCLDAQIAAQATN